MLAFFGFVLLVLADARPTVHVKDGLVAGIAEGSVGVWRGIPFAAPPVGDLRWRPPQPPIAWGSKPLDATNFRHNCYQGMGMGWPQPFSTQAEDCLYLNVYAPLKNASKPLPVMLWIYGGGYQGGGGNETRLNGTWDVALMEGTRNEFIVVTFNYRNNIFGFAASDKLRSRDPLGGTGNYGVLDQRMAMQWVHDNIGAFGGDASRVYIVGQSAGANSVSNHLVRPKSWDLFQAAGLESGAFYDGKAQQSVADVEQKFSKLMASAGCSDVDCLLKVPELELFQKRGGEWMPVVDGVDLTARGVELAAQGKLAPVPIIVGSVMEDINTLGTNCKPTECTEADFRKLLTKNGLLEKEVDAAVTAYEDEEVRTGGPAYSKWWWAEKHAGADSWGTCPARRLARWATVAGQSAYYYYWTYAPKGINGKFPQLAHHACEQPFVFHVLSETSAETREDEGKYHIDASEQKFSAEVVSYWASFAASGVPAASVPWPKFDFKDQTALVFGDDMKISSQRNVRGARCDVWDAVFNRSSENELEFKQFVI